MAELFGEDLGSFKPERFIRPALITGKVADPKMVRAFGGGISLCPGRFFAGNEILSYAASILWRFDFEFKDNGMVRIAPRKHW
jgi:cytochrome P450